MVAWDLWQGQVVHTAYGSADSWGDLGAHDAFSSHMLIGGSSRCASDGGDWQMGIDQDHSGGWMTPCTSEEVTPENNKQDGKYGIVEPHLEVEVK